MNPQGRYLIPDQPVKRCNVSRLTELTEIAFDHFNIELFEGKLKKWSCGCQNVRVAIADFSATCNKCGNEFIQQ